MFGRRTKHEELLDPEGVAAGNVVRFRRSTPDRIVRSLRPAHPAIVSVEDFTQVQLLRRSKGASGLHTARKTERTERPVQKLYLFRGRIRRDVFAEDGRQPAQAHHVLPVSSADVGTWFACVG